MIKLRRYYWILLICLPLLMGIDSCFGLREFMQGAKGNSPTEPCAEAIPLPTPIGSPTPAAGPAPQNTPIISAGTPIVGVVTVLPPPHFFALVNIQTSQPGKCAGYVSPLGQQEVSPGTKLSITVTISAVPCTTCYVQVDNGSQEYFTCPPLGFSYTYELDVEEDHNVLVYLYGF
jgi:hypothetical protein